MPSHPVTRFHQWFNAAHRAGVPLAEAMALATVDGRGRPAVRYVLLKSADRDGFVFYTNVESRKGVDLAARPHAALAFYWHATGRQVRVSGRVESVSEPEADSYWSTRPKGSQLASAASQQSQPLAERRLLIARYRALARQYRELEVPRPPHWRGYRVVPDEMEFWTREEPRLHRRELFLRTRQGWTKTILQP